jgi:hypothetical protein
MHNEELHNLYPLPNIVRMMKSRRMSWMKNVAYMIRILERKNHLGDQGIDERVVVR